MRIRLTMIARAGQFRRFVLSLFKRVIIGEAKEKAFRVCRQEAGGGRVIVPDGQQAHFAGLVPLFYSVGL